jgi:hypothetical protein
MEKEMNDLFRYLIVKNCIFIIINSLYYYITLTFKFYIEIQILMT